MGDKIDMSLDDIIKHNKPARGRGGRSRGGRGASRGRGRGGTRGAGPIRTGRGRGRTTTPYSRPRDLPDVWQHDMYNKASGTPKRTSAGATGLSTGSKLHISNLDFGVTESDIQELFQEFGTIKSATLNYDQSGRSHGTADIVYVRKDDALKAFNTYNGVPLDGRPMKIEMISSDLQASPAPAQRGSYRTETRGNRRQSFGDGNRRSGNQQTRGGRGGRGRGIGGRGRGGSRGRRGGKPVSKDQLDAELDAYKDKGEGDIDMD